MAVWRLETVIMADGRGKEKEVRDNKKSKADGEKSGDSL